jgi:hypothetical protein
MNVRCYSVGSTDNLLWYEVKVGFEYYWRINDERVRSGLLGQGN